MQRITAALLMLLMVLPFFGCAVAENESPVFDNTSMISSGEELREMAKTTSKFSKTVAVDDAYVRSGTYGNNVMPIQDGALELKYVEDETSNYTRDILIRFDLTDLTLAGMNRVQILLDFKASNIKNEEKGSVLAYGISNNWSSDTVTYNNAPTYDASAPVGEGLVSKVGICQIDVSDYVFDQRNKGATEVSFRLCLTEEWESQSTVFSYRCSYETRRPVLRADYCPRGQTFVTDVYEEAAANKALWAYAQSLYDDWYVRYGEILAKGDASAAFITSDADDFALTVDARGGTPTATVRTFKTRLMTSLSGYTPTTTEESVYGGDLSAERQEATGRFYTKKVDGRWWVIDPLGYPCYIRGINHMNYSYQSASPYQTEKMLEVYGSAEKWAIAATRWLQEGYRINVAAGWHSTIADVQDGLSYISRPAGMAGYASKLGMIYQSTPTQLLYNNAMPVFDPAFAAYVDEQVKLEVERYADRSRILGYATDNEILISKTALSQYLTLDYTEPKNIYSYAVAWTFYRNITGEDAPKINDIEMYSAKLDVDLQDLFQGFVYDRYHKVCAMAIRAYDPDGLYMGARSLTESATSEWYMRFTGYWCDIYCVNYYSSWEISEDILYNVEKWLDAPMLITEFYAKGMDAISPLGKPYPNTDGAGWVVETQTERGYFYQNFCLRLLESKNCIGWLYFQYIDNDPHVNSAASNKGMVNCDHNTEVYEAFNSQMAMINENVYGLIDFFDNK